MATTAKAGSRRANCPMWTQFREAATNSSNSEGNSLRSLEWMPSKHSDD